MPNFHEILSPLPGTFYRAAAPDAPAFKSDGDRVAIGEVIGIVEVMKQFSEITSDVGGRLLCFLVEDTTMVDPGQPLARVETDA